MRTEVGTDVGTEVGTDLTADADGVDQDVVRAIVHQVWESLLQAAALPWTDPAAPLPAAQVTAEVALAGDWTGRVRLGCDLATARSLARAMLDLDPDQDVSSEDVEDAVGEVVNVVGGNVKGTLPGSTALGLPQVRRDSPVEGDADPGGPVTRYVVDWAGSPVLVEVEAGQVT